MALLKIVSFILVLNLCMYIGLNYTTEADKGFRLKSDLFDLILTNSSEIDQAVRDDIARNYTTTNTFNISSDFSSTPEAKGGEQIGVGGISGLDLAKIILAIFPTIGNVMLAPVTLFTGFGIPVMFQILIGLPLALISFLSLIIFLRGGGG